MQNVEEVAARGGGSDLKGLSCEETSLLECSDESTQDSGESEDEVCKGCCVYLAENDAFKVLVTVMIILNAVAMGVQVDHPSAHTHVFGHRIRVWRAVGAGFLSLFVFDISIRMCAVGCWRFFCDRDEWAWNLFDFVVVFGGFGDHLSEEYLEMVDRNKGVTNGRGLMMTRMLRILRVLRVMRVVHRLRKLRLLVRGLLEAMEISFWLFVTCLFCIFISAIVCTTILGHETAASEESLEDFLMYFGTVGRSMFTLFQFITMDDWAAVSDLVVREGYPVMRLFFLIFVFFGGFVMMSALTGVMADHMNDARRREAKEDRRRKIHDREHAIRVVQDVDINSDDTLDPEEFEQLLSHRAIKKDLSVAGIVLRPQEAREMFEWFDVNGDGLIDSEELYQGLKHMFEGITGLQMHKLKVAIEKANHVVAERRGTKLSRQLPARHQPSEVAKRRLAELTGTLGGLEVRMDTFEAQVRTFMLRMGSSPVANSDASPTWDMSPT